MTDGPDEGKIAVLDFGLVAEVPQRDREAILSAIIHLANRDWWEPARFRPVPLIAASCRRTSPPAQLWEDVHTLPFTRLSFNRSFAFV